MPGYHVVAPDLRGYGRTTGWHADYDFDADLRSFRLLNAVRDQLGLVHALGLRSVAAVVGHDFGSPVAAWCALVRPDVFRSVVLMSAPFEGPPDLTPAAVARRHPCAAMATLPRPRKHYQWYYSHAPRQRRHVALQAGRARVPARLLPPQERRLAAEQAVPPGRAGPPRNWRRCRPTTSWTSARRWRRRSRTRCHPLRRSPHADGCPTTSLRSTPANTSATASPAACSGIAAARPGLDTSELQLFAGRTIDVPSMFIAGSSDWGTYQRPGAFERMQESACTQHDRLPPDRRRRPLGAAGTGREGQRAGSEFLRR